jgi:hypothetical protein
LRGTLLGLDPVDLRVVRRLTIPHQFEGEYGGIGPLGLSSVGDVAYGVYDSGGVARLELSTGLLSIIARLGTSEDSRPGIAVSPDGNSLYVPVWEQPTDSDRLRLEIIDLNT